MSIRFDWLLGKMRVRDYTSPAPIDTPPTYTPATLVLGAATVLTAEVGTSYNLVDFTATFNQNDAGTLSAIKIQKMGVDMTPNGLASPFVKTDSGVLLNGSIVYQSFANYGAGIIKNYTPSGTPDARTPLIRNVNAPQAAENNFASNTVSLNGFYKIFYGPGSVTPSNSVQVRALPNNVSANAGNVIILNTGITLLKQSFSIPVGKTLVIVVDLDAGNFDITSSFVLSIFNVNDAGAGTPSYKNYSLSLAVPYSTNHRYQITLS